MNKYIIRRHSLVTSTEPWKADSRGRYGMWEYRERNGSNILIGDIRVGDTLHVHALEAYVRALKPEIVALRTFYYTSVSTPAVVRVVRSV